MQYQIKSKYFAFVLIWSVLPMLGLGQTLFSSMSNQITCTSCLGKSDSSLALTRFGGADTLIFSEGIGNTTQIIIDETKVTHIRCRYHKLIPRALLVEGKTYKIYQTLYFQYKQRKTALFLRETPNSVFFMFDSDSIKYDQLLFYYKAELEKDKWEIRGFPTEDIYEVCLIQKYYNPNIGDTVYCFQFYQKCMHCYILWAYVSKKYGILGLRNNAFSDWFTNDNINLGFCETWFYPYY